MITPTIQNIMSTFVHFFLFVIRRNKGLEKKKTIHLFISVFPRCSNIISGECGDRHAVEAPDALAGRAQIDAVRSGIRVGHDPLSRSDLPVPVPSPKLIFDSTTSRWSSL